MNHSTWRTRRARQLAGEAEQLTARLSEAAAGGENAEKRRAEVSTELEAVTRELSAARAEAEKPFWRV